MVSFVTLSPVFAMATAYAPEQLGYFSLAQSVLALPSQMIGLSIGKVFFQKTSEVLNTEGIEVFKEKLVKIFYGTLFLAIIPFALVFSFGETLFIWFAGEQWGVAGKFAAYLALSGSFQFVWAC